MVPDVMDVVNERHEDWQFDVLKRVALSGRNVEMKRTAAEGLELQEACLPADQSTRAFRELVAFSRRMADGAYTAALRDGAEARAALGDVRRLRTRAEFAERVRSVLNERGW
ncbi:hypothetical protein [Streptomyces ehimensis]|uniref:Uncharacterized protein n=1 Tax=Streptomyces ehimensis TaxID=68195 RepID=A0ABV9BEX8_9ACTN